MLTASDVLGTWKMLTWQREVLATGETVDALGPDPVGYFSYGADGRMMALVVRADRAVPSGLPTKGQKAELYDSMLAYAGTWTIDEEKLVYRIDISWNQVWTGTEQIRVHSMEGDKLVLTDPPSRNPHDGREVVPRIAWRKVKPSD
jgi:hypothetical protein